MSEVQQGALDPFVAPSRVLGSQTQHQIDEFLLDSGAPHALPSIAVVPLFGYESTVPTEDRVRASDVRYLL